MTKMQDDPSIQGLLLIGGQSSRMGRDKAGIEIAPGQTLQDRAVALFKELGLEAFLSVASSDDRPQPLPVIRDLEENLGPLGAISSAFKSQPGHAWLVLACDMPNLQKGALQSLLQERDPSRDCTCFLNPADDHPEPLCAIYEPSAAPAITAAVNKRRLCARKLLRSLNRKELPAPSTKLLDNCNRPEHLTELEMQRTRPAVTKNVTVEYFASLREPAGTAREEVTTEVHTAAGLWDELRLRHGFHLDLDAVRLARNDEFAEWTTPLSDGDRLSFLPPFAGG